MSIRYKNYDKLISNFVMESSKNKNIEAIYLFGSYLENFGNLSDIDICIFGKLSKKDKKMICREASEILDISFFDELPIFIKVRVFSKGKELYLKKGKDLENLKFLTLKQYRDFMFFMKGRIFEKFNKI